jgi:hypothetical protein
MNKSLRRRAAESSRKTIYGFRRGTATPKKEPPFPAALKLITGRRQTEWTGATRCPNEDKRSHRRESLINRKRTIIFRFRLPYRPLAEGDDARNSLDRRVRENYPLVMPGLDPGIHVFAAASEDLQQQVKRRRGWPGQARP